MLGIPPLRPADFHWGCPASVAKAVDPGPLGSYGEERNCSLVKAAGSESDQGSLSSIDSHAPARETLSHLGSIVTDVYDPDPVALPHNIRKDAALSARIGLGTPLSHDSPFSSVSARNFPSLLSLSILILKVHERKSWVRRNIGRTESSRLARGTAAHLPEQSWGCISTPHFRPTAFKDTCVPCRKAVRTHHRVAAALSHTPRAQANPQLRIELLLAEVFHGFTSRSQANLQISTCQRFRRHWCSGRAWHWGTYHLQRRMWPMSFQHWFDA